MTGIDQIARYLEDHYYLEFADTLKHIINDIFLCIFKEQCSDQEEYKCKLWKGCQIKVHDGLHQIK
jgi:hypothetical protein